MLDATFIAMGVHFSTSELEQLRSVLRSQLDMAFDASPRSEIVIDYESPQGLHISYQVKALWATVGEAYDRWARVREAPFFGSEPDARVMALSAEYPHPSTCRVLDVGAGTGRNALALARRGHPVDAVEMSPRMIALLQGSAQEHSLDQRILAMDILKSQEHLHGDYGLVVVSEVTSDFRGVDDLCGLFERVSAHMAPGGRLLVSIFLARDDYVPDAAAHQLAQQCYSTFFSRAEIASSSAESGLILVEDLSVLDYEREHLPVEAWPPTPWFEEWVTGRDVFDVPREICPIDMRWLVYRKA